MAEQLTIGATNLNTPGSWRVRDFVPLLDITVRGENVLAPHVAGRIATIPRLDEHVVSLELMIFGATRALAIANLVALRTALFTPDGNETVAATYTIGATSYTADVQVIPPIDAASQTNAYIRGVLRLRVPAGMFVP